MLFPTVVPTTKYIKIAFGLIGRVDILSYILVSLQTSSDNDLHLSFET